VVTDLADQRILNPKPTVGKARMITNFLYINPTNFRDWLIPDTSGDKSEGGSKNRKIS